MIFHESKEFVKHLDNFIDTPNNISSNFLNSNKTRIPLIFRNYTTKLLYRGKFLTDEDRELLEKGKYKIDRVTSWTKDESIARKFLLDSKFTNQKKKDHRVIFAKRFSSVDIIIDIDAYVSFYGEDKLIELGFDDLRIDSAIKEKEVVIAPVSIRKSEFKSI